MSRQSKHLTMELFSDEALMSPSSSSRSQRRSYSRTPTPLTWTQFIQKHFGTIAIGIVALSVSGYCVYKLLHATPADGRRGRKGKKRRGGKHFKSNRTSAPANEEEEEDENEEPRTPVGMRNVGNSCFLNALLQSLQSCPPFLEFLIRLHGVSAQLVSLPPQLLQEAVMVETERILQQQPSAAYMDEMQAFYTQSAQQLMMRCSNFFNELLPLIAVLSSPSVSTLNPAPFYRLLVSEASGKFSGFNQQDAHELLHVLLDILERKASQIERVRRGLMRMEKIKSRGEGLESLVKEQSNDPRAVAAVLLQSLKSSLSELGIDAKSEAESPVSIASETEKEDSPNSSLPTTPTHNMSSSTSSTSSSVAEPESKPALSPSNVNPTTAQSALAAAVRILSSPACEMPTDPFQGLLSHFLICQHCRTPSSSIRHSPFESLSLNFHDISNTYGMNRSGVESGNLTLESMLHEYVKTETVEGVRCENCNWTLRKQQLNAFRQSLPPLASVEKAKKKRVRLDEVVAAMEQEIFAHLTQLQPNPGSLLKQQQTGETKLQSLNKNSTSASDGSPAAASESPNFLAPEPSSDPLLNYRSSSDGSVKIALFPQLLSQLSNEEFAKSLPLHAADKLLPILGLDTKRNFSKGSAISRLPPSICFHLNRLQGGAHQKVSTHVPFPMRLGLLRYTSDWLHEEYGTNIGLSSTGAANSSRFAAHRLARSSLHGGVDPEREKACMYELEAVVVHQGGGSGGHYITYRRQVLHRTASPPAATKPQQNPSANPTSNTGVEFVNDETSQSSAADASLLSLDASSSAPATSTSPVPLPPIITWWYISDDNCQQVDVDEVMQAQAYLLFYTHAK